MKSSFFSSCLPPVLIILMLQFVYGCLLSRPYGELDKDSWKTIRDEDIRPLATEENCQPQMDVQPQPRLQDNGKPIDLSIEQATMLLLLNNQSLKVNRLNPILKKSVEKIERAGFDPEIFARVEYLKEEMDEDSPNIDSDSFTENLLTWGTKCN